MQISVRCVAGPASAPVQAVVREAFGRPEEAELVARLSSHADVLVLVASVDGEVAGVALFSPVTPPGATRAPLIRGLAPVAVLPALQRRGVGKRLIEVGLEELRRSQVELVVVLGDPAYYGRFGFVAAAPLGLFCKWGGEDGAFQALELVPGAAAKCRGRLAYSPVFDEFAG